MDNATKAAVLEILGTVPDMTIATMREDGYPQATTVSFVNDGLTIYFGTGAQSQKAHNIGRNDKVSLTVNCTYRSWEEIKGLSLAGTARQVTDASEAQHVGQLMFAKFPQIGRFVSTDAGDLTLFRVTPSVVYLLDYSKGFGHTERFVV
ncbi:MAG: pyridoxamine 5'-phosphate oxidase family protein [Rhizomicrobium sp.]